jgi:hypothetical protein
MELKDLFRILSERASDDGWEPVLHYLFRPGHERVQYPSGEPLTDTMHVLLHRIEYNAIPLVAINTETEDALRTERLVYHPDTETYHYGVMTTPWGELDTVVCWYAVPSLLNDALHAWLQRYWSTRDTERFLDELILLCKR